MSLPTCLFCLLAAATPANNDIDSSAHRMGNPLLAQTSGGTGSLNYSNYTITVTEYTGDCPGYRNPSWNDVSFLGKVPPGPFQRVKITNTATGGYTNREYDERRTRSEPFGMGLGNGHSSRQLNISDGLNPMTYQIINRKTGLVDQGEFSIKVTRHDRTVARNFTKREQEVYCEGEKSKTSDKTSVSLCKEGYYISELVGTCPDGSKRQISLDKLAIPRPLWR